MSSQNSLRLGRLLLRSLLMLVMVELEQLVSRVRLLHCLQLPLPSLRGFGSMFIAAWCGEEVHAFGGGRLGCRGLIVMLCTLEQLALTEQLGELAVVARGQPSLSVGDNLVPSCCCCCVELFC